MDDGQQQPASSVEKKSGTDQIRTKRLRQPEADDEEKPPETNGKQESAADGDDGGINGGEDEEEEPKPKKRQRFENQGSRRNRNLILPSALPCDYAEKQHELEEKLKQLSATQRQVYDRATSGRRECMFVTGGAGKGKTFLLSLIVSKLRMDGLEVAVLAPTGLAAHLIEGRTIASFLKLRTVRNDGTAPSISRLAKWALQHEDWVAEYRSLDYLVIDESSMLASRDLMALDAILTVCRSPTPKSAIGSHRKPFGGLPVLLFGDFFQLPPVQKSRSATYCFQTPVWAAAFPPSNCYELMEDFRQQDPLFIALLARIRVGQATMDDQRLLHSICQKTKKSRDVGLELLCYRAAVDRVNEEEQTRLEEKGENKPAVYDERQIIKPWTGKQLKETARLVKLTKRRGIDNSQRQRDLARLALRQRTVEEIGRWKKAAA